MNNNNRDNKLIKDHAQPQIQNYLLDPYNNLYLMLRIISIN